MNRSFIWAGVGVGAVAAYVGASWLCGHFVDNSFEVWQQNNQGRLPPFIVVQHQYTPGVFHSSHLTTIRVDADALEKFLPRKAGAQKTAAHIDSDPAAVTEATPGPQAKQAVAAEPLVIIIIRHDVSHGPFPDFNSTGLARVQTHIVLSAEARKALSKVIGNKEPVSAVTQLGLTGGGVTEITSPAFDVIEGDQRIIWQGVQGRFAFSRHSDSVQGGAKAPGLTLNSDKGKFVVGELSVQCNLNRLIDQLYGGTMQFTAAGLDGTYNDAGVPKHIRMEKIGYGFDIIRAGDYFDMVARVGMAHLDTADIVLSDLAYDFTVKHLHTATYAAMMKKIQNISYWNTSDTATQAAMRGAFQEFGPQLLEHNPELVIDRITATFPEGTASLSASVKLPGFTRADMEGMRALGKLEAIADLSVAQALIEKKWSAKTAQDANGDSPAVARMNALKTQATQMEQQGFITNRNGQYESHLEFKQGHLTVNGKTLR
jgi:uncharacterized protein YdgA (DUF945 family)